MKFIGRFFLLIVAILFGACYALQQTNPSTPTSVAITEELKVEEDELGIEVKGVATVSETEEVTPINPLSQTGKGLDKAVSVVFKSMMKGLSQ